MKIYIVVTECSDGAGNCHYDRDDEGYIAYDSIEKAQAYVKEMGWENDSWAEILEVEIK